jgi:hypothetical protein
MNLRPGSVKLCLAARPAPNRAATLSYPAYAREILAHAGLPFAEVTRDELRSALSPETILLLVGDAALSPGEGEALATFVAAGGSVVAVGSTSGAPALFGVAEDLPAGVEGWGIGAPTLGEGYVAVAHAAHPILAGLASSLHFFNGIAVHATEGVALATVRDAHGRCTPRAAVVEHVCGRGRALLLAPDLPGAVVYIQQGRTVDADGIPAPDGSAALSDGLLKAEDGMVLDWELDRVPVPGLRTSGFLHPVADEWRALLLRSLLYAASAGGLVLPLLWYYPDNLLALGHLSHDTDGHDPRLGARLLEVIRELDLQDTWCVIMPGYPADLYAALREAGQEIALHFDALEMGELSRFCEANLRGQHAWLGAAARPAGSRELPRLVTNKNHYTRWEGRLQFFEWCERLGIQAEQSRGPSKLGCLGFPFGTSHPWFPIRDDGTTIDVLEVGFQAQDLVIYAPPPAGRALVDACLAHHGILHLIFHPAHIEKPGVADALRALVAYGRERGLAWWPCDRINAWERARRTISLALRADGDGLRTEITARTDMPGATLLFLMPEGTPARVSEGGSEPVSRYGFPFLAVRRDLPAAQPIIIRLQPSEEADAPSSTG